MLPAYTLEEINDFFSRRKGHLRVVTLLILKLGLRYKEATYSYFSAIKFQGKTILIHGKTEFNYRTKTALAIRSDS